MSHGPIDPRHRANMNMMANAIDDVLNDGKQPKKFGFCMLVAEFGKIDNGRVNYISNGSRADMLTMMKEFIARAEGRYAEGGAA
ncbi:hypothetical protein SAMN05518801_10773 [Novosphingobium sp. CF614]|uniref:hypothetical protein n=1 Tax=Novosphingobium sp. CF614 TaxID=1884364 RepID=UPI0008E5A4D4|nr:hypothetical protein [Novosphingobium sp. CF614]SFG09109.1 hypothetical protein SAMN05518801_10773 [Novosphingobium sp. CF614]